MAEPDCSRCSGRGCYYDNRGCSLTCQCTEVVVGRFSGELNRTKSGKIAARRQYIQHMVCALWQAEDRLSLSACQVAENSRWDLRYGVLRLYPHSLHVYDILAKREEDIAAVLQDQFALRSVNIVRPVTAAEPSQDMYAEPDYGIYEQNLGEVALVAFGRGDLKVETVKPIRKGYAAEQRLTRWFRTPVLGHKGVFRKIEVSVCINPVYGIPGSEDQDFLFALFKLTAEEANKTGEIPKTLYYVPRQVLTMTKRSDQIANYHALHLAIQRWFHNSIAYWPKGWYDAKTDTWVTIPHETKSDADQPVGFCVIQAATPLFVLDKEKDEWVPRLSALKAEGQLPYVVWSNRIHDNLETNYYTWKIPAEILFGLPEGVPRALFLYAYKRLRGGNKKIHREPLDELYEGRFGLAGLNQGPAYAARKLRLTEVRTWTDEDGRKHPTYLRVWIDKKTRQIAFQAENGFGWGGK